MIKQMGFTLIELVIFVVVLGIVSAIITTSVVFSLRYIPIEHNQTVAMNKSTKCMEYFLGKRYMEGFNFSQKNKKYFCTRENDFKTSAQPIKKVEIDDFEGEQAFKLITVETKTPQGSTFGKFSLIIADY